MKVFVGLSGGVDSAVAAHLLHTAGHDVTGVFIKIWQPEFLECTWEEDRLSAKRIAAALGIPFREVDFSEEYKAHVVADMIAAYERGITPNPDVLCNRFIKFGVFSTWAKTQGAEKIATGHYARIIEREGAHELHRGVDESKDQSYFLHRLTQDDLAFALFPIGKYTKREIRQIARRAELPNAARPDSQGLCFVGDVAIGDFLARYVTLTPGNVLDTKGRSIGEHAGAARYTIGQRHGFSLGAQHEAHVSPHYIVGIDTKANTVTVSERIEDAYKKRALLTDATWIGSEPPTETQLDVQARYHQPVNHGQLSEVGDMLTLTLKEPQVLTPGQSAVLYDGSRCLGGGVIAG